MAELLQHGLHPKWAKKSPAMPNMRAGRAIGCCRAFDEIRANYTAL